MNEWTADITNDPERDFDLCIDVYEGDVHRARIEPDGEGHLVLRVYAVPQDVSIPLQWLSGIIQRAQSEIGQSHQLG